MRSALVALTLLLSSLLHAQERTLRWKSLEVTAKLENDGTLRVSERHRMLFDGDWNGGQRVFRVGRGQQLSLLSMSRVDERGRKRPMALTLSERIALHEYGFDGTTLRWRAREASAPPFRNAERVYVVDYLVRNIVARQGDHYVLSHDFAFTDRPGPIESFSAKLDLDSAFQPPVDFVSLYERTDLPPGESAVLTVRLQRTGEGEPQYLATPALPDATPAQGVSSTPPPSVPEPPPPPPASTIAKLTALLAFLTAAILLTIWFWRREAGLGRFEPRPRVTPEWLEHNLLVHRAEVVGAAWDGATGPGEVAALIATMTTEGKIENVAGAPRLRLLVPRESLSEYERGFVDALFIEGNEISPEKLRKHYGGTGFEPAKSITAPLAAAASRLVRTGPGATWKWGCVAFVATLFVFPFMACAFVVTLALAYWYGRRLGGRALAMCFPVPLLLAAMLHTLINTSLGWLVANLVAGAVLFAIALRLASWRGTGLELRNLVNFIAARKYLRQRIVLQDPVVDPRWIPYMLAFGLTPDDRWSVTAARPHRPEARRDEDRRTTPSTSRASSSPPSATARPAAPAFQSGGGGFGGAGATGSWASIQTFATTVAAKPARSSSSFGSSSSSSSGSGWSWSSGGGSSSSSSSRSSSGGGGGGGW